MTKRTIWTLCKYLLAFGLLGFVVYSNWDVPGGKGLKDVWREHVVEGKPVHSEYFLVAAILIAVGVVITQIRWYVLVRAQELPFTLSEAMRLGWIGFVFNTFLPGSVGGDIVKAAALARAQERRAAAVATVIMDRVIGLWGLVMFVALVGGVCWSLGLLDGEKAEQARAIVTGAAIFTAVSIGCWAVMGLISRECSVRFRQRLGGIPKIGGTLGELWQAAWLYRSRQGSVMLAMGITWINQACSVAVFYFCARTLWDGLPSNPLPTLAQHFLLVPICSVIAAIPLFPGGAGIGEAGFGGLYKFFGSAAANGVLGSLVMRVGCWLMAGIGIVVYQLLQWKRRHGSSDSVASHAEKQDSPETGCSGKAAA